MTHSHGQSAQVTPGECGRHELTGLCLKVAKFFVVSCCTRGMCFAPSLSRGSGQRGPHSRTMNGKNLAPLTAQ